MKSAFTTRIGRLGLPLIAALAILGAAGVSVATSTSDTHAALKWNEHAAPSPNPMPSQASDTGIANSGR